MGAGVSPAYEPPPPPWRQSLVGGRHTNQLGQGVPADVRPGLAGSARPNSCTVVPPRVGDGMSPVTCLRHDASDGSVALMPMPLSAATPSTLATPPIMLNHGNAYGGGSSSAETSSNVKHPTVSMRVDSSHWGASDSQQSLSETVSEAWDIVVCLLVTSSLLPRNTPLPTPPAPSKRTSSPSVLPHYPLSVPILQNVRR